MEINKPIATAILLVINLLLLFFFDIPKFNESSALQQQLAQKQAEYDGKNAYYDSVFATLKDIKSRKDALAKIDSALPLDLSYSQLIYFVQEKEAENGMINQSISFAAPAAGGGAPDQTTGQPAAKQVQSISFTANTSGTYDGLKNFLRALENSSRIFEVDSISLQNLQSFQRAPQQANEPSSFQFKVVIRTNIY